MFFMLFFILYLIIISEIFSVSNVTDRSNIIHISMLHSYSPMLHLSYSRYIFLQEYYIVALLSLCIGRTASIYQTCRIYISDMQYLYIQYHRYIDAKRGNRTCLKLHCLLWIRTSNVIILNITCSGSHHYLFSGQIFFK